MKLDGAWRDRVRAVSTKGLTDFHGGNDEKGGLAGLCEEGESVGTYPFDSSKPLVSHRTSTHLSNPIFPFCYPSPFYYFIFRIDLSPRSYYPELDSSD
jgi:hypothetical protein